MSNHFPISVNHEDGEENWSEFHKFATSIGSSRTKNDSPTTDGRNRETDLAVEKFIGKYRTERYRGRGELLQEMEFKDVTFMDYRTAKELRSSGINVKDPDLATIRKAALFLDRPQDSKVGSSQGGLEMMEPHFVRASSTMSLESSGQFEDAKSDVEPPNSRMTMFSSMPQGVTIERPVFGSIPDPVYRSVYKDIYPVSDAPALDQSANDIFNYKFDETGYVKGDPASLGVDSPTPSPCSSPLPDDEFLNDEIIESKTDTKVQKMEQINTSTPLEHQIVPDKTIKDLRDFILGFKTKLSEHPEVLTCFLDVVTAWTSEEIAFLEMKESLTVILSDSFPDLLEGFMQFTKDIEFPQVLANPSVKPRRKHRNLVVMNFWKKEEERQQNGKAHEDHYNISIIKDCLSQLRETGVSKELAQPAKSADGAAVKNDENNCPPLGFPYEKIPYTGGRGMVFSMADID